MLYIENIVSGLLGYLPNLGQAILVLIVGYFVALIGSRLIGRILEAKSLNSELWSIITDEPTSDPKASTINLAYNILFFCVLISFFGALGMGWVASILVMLAIIIIIIVIVATFGEKIKKVIQG